MTGEEIVREVAGRMRAAGWRGDEEERLLRTARKRVALAARHEEQAEQLAAKDAFPRWRIGPDYPSAPRSVDAARPADRNSEFVLVHQVRAAACLIVISRRERDIALRLAPTWTLAADELLVAAKDVLT